MNEELHIDTQGEKLIQSFEGCKKKAYFDSVGVLTIGWGHTNAVQPNFSPAAVWTQAMCDEVFRKDIIKYEDAVKRNVQVKLTQGQFNSLVSLTYNIGEGNLKKSQLLRKLNSGDYEAAGREFSKWNKAGGQVLAGLTRRRSAEALVYASLSPSVAPDEPMAQEVDAPEKSNPLNSKIVQMGGTAAVAGASVATSSMTDSSVIDQGVDAIGKVHTVKEYGFFDWIMNVPELAWVGLGIMALSGLIIYFRIKDHD